MDELLKTLERLGVPAETREKAQQEFAGDPDGMTVFVLGCLAEYDDRHEYVD